MAEALRIAEHARAARVAERYRVPLGPPSDWNDTLDLLLSHRSVRAYDRRLRTFRREQGMPERDWSEQAAQRVRGADALAGRHLLRAALDRLGFHLD